MQSPAESADRVPRRPLAYAANRDRLLDAAIELFAERGYEAVSTGSVARAAGLTQSMVHYYFGTKAALWQAAVEEVMRRRGARFDIAQSDLRDIDPLSRLKVIIRRFVSANAADPDLTRILVHEGLTRSDRVHWLSQQFMRPGYELFNKTIQDGIDAGQIRPQDPRDVTNIIVGASTLAFSLSALLADVYHEDESPWLDIDRLSDTLLDVLFHGLQVKRTLGNGDDAETV